MSLSLKFDRSSAAWHDWVALTHRGEDLLRQCNVEMNNETLQEAVECFKTAALLSRNGVGRSLYTFGTLANALIIRYEQVGDLVDLEYAHIIFSRLLKWIRPGHPARSDILNGLGIVLDLRFVETGDLADLDQAVAVHQRALKLRPQGHPDRSTSLSNLGIALLHRFKQVGARGDLEDGVAHLHCAVQLTPPGHPDRSTTLCSLATTLRSRFEEFGDRADLDQAVVLHQRALKLAPLCHPSRYNNLGKLGNSLFIRFEQFGDHQDWDRAVVLYQSALELTPLGHHLRHENLGNLANVLAARFDHSKDRNDLDQAIALYRSAVELDTPGGPDRFVNLYNLARAHKIRFDEVEDINDLFLALFLSQKALEFTPPDHPLHPDITRAYFLACLVEPRFCSSIIRHAQKARFGSKDDTEKSQDHVLNLLREATSATAGGPTSSRLRTSLLWVDLAMKWSNASALDAYRVSLSLLETLLAAGRSMQSRHLRLTSELSDETRNLAIQGAACALASNQVELAVEILEQGRSILLTQAGKYRTKVDDLDAVDPTLAAEFRRLSTEMEGSVMVAEHPDTNGNAAHPTKDAVAVYQKLLEQWNNVVDKIRSLSGFSTFLLPSPFEVLRKAAIDGPVIILIITDQSSTAIIVQFDAVPHVVYLVDAALQETSELNKNATSRTTTAEFKFLLRRLWEIIVKPIAEVLQNNLQIPKGSRIWWCPTGATSHLPLHAAGEYFSGGSALPNLYISSYTTTLQSLIKSREQVTHHIGPDSGPLVVGQAGVSDLDSLESVRHEIDSLRKLFPSATILDGVEATGEAILNGMAQHRYLHLSCHGHVNQKEPFNSHFSIIDGPLTLGEIVRRGLPNADLAFLSACHSATGNRDRSDEALHLVAGLQFAGYRSVVGTLWEMADSTGAMVTKEFWSSIQKAQKEGKDGAAISAKALHRAVNALRRASPKVAIVDWACFVHYGC